MMAKVIRKKTDHGGVHAPWVLPVPPVPPMQHQDQTREIGQVDDLTASIKQAIVMIDALRKKHADLIRVMDRFIQVVSRHTDTKQG